MTGRLARAAAVLAPVVGLVLAGCGGGGGAADPAGSPPAATSTASAVNAEQASLDVLRGWEDELVVALVLGTERARAHHDGKLTRTMRLDRRLNRILAHVKLYGRDARRQLHDVTDAKSARAAIRAADAWTQWANELRKSPPGDDFDKTRYIAQLGARALLYMQRAYAATGTQPPPAFQGDPGVPLPGRSSSPAASGG
jgi:hypothetical protein